MFPLDDPWRWLLNVAVGVAALLALTLVATAAHIIRIRRQLDREFYNALGPERSNIPCRITGCTRGAAERSVYCESHHFERIHGRRCPFHN